MISKIKGELLAPAGNLESAITAFKCGADAVYAGFSRFNAREMNKNFDIDDMSRLSAYAKKHQKKYYNTFNTLIKEDELELVLETIDSAIALDPDALIIQDIGIATLIKSIWPKVQIHASTQMGLHNSYSIEMAQKLGFSRVILEREVTLEELKLIAKKSPLELEVFIHGSLCCSLSGCCLFSSWIGGHSGNRGKCKQPCRRRYYTKGIEKNGFFFSPSDLAMIDSMRDLIDLGINSFKIEGRLKRLDYIESTVTAYRKMIDAAFEKREKKEISEAKKILSSSPGRFWSVGFYSKDNFNKLIQSNKPAISGRLAGKIIDSNSRGVKILATELLTRGDRVRFQSNSGNEMPSFTLLKFTNLTKNVSHHIRRGENAIIHTNIKIEKGSRLYLIGKSKQIDNEKIRKLPFYERQKKIDLEIIITKHGIRVVANYQDFSLEPISLNCKFEEANLQCISKEQIQNIFKQSSTNKYKTDKMDITIRDNPFIPLKQLKEFRRAVWIEIIDIIEKKSLTHKKIEYANEIFRCQNNLKQKQLIQNFPITTTILANQINKVENTNEKIKQALSIHTKCNFENENKIEWILPLFCPENELDILEKKIIEKIKIGSKVFRVSSLYQIKMLQKISNKTKTDLYIFTSFPLPITNSITAFYLLQFCSKVQLWLELSKDDIDFILKKVPLASSELFVGGYPSLLVTRAEIPSKGDIHDARSIKFKIQKEDDNLFHLYSAKEFKITVSNNVSLFYDYRGGDPDPNCDEEKSTFNYLHKWN